MKKIFNISGNCSAYKHYMMDNSAKIDAVMVLVERGEYFTINRPRQYGKTTTLKFIDNRLKESDEYLAIRLNFQGIDNEFHSSDNAFAKMFIRVLGKVIRFSFRKEKAFLDEILKSVTDMETLSDAITELVHHFPQKLVLLIDEVDASTEFKSFLKFLGVLRTKYLDRDEAFHATFHSVILVGVHDIKNLKFKMKNPNQLNYNSPWNIAIDFTVDMKFSPAEIAPMLEEYSEAEGITMDVAAISKCLHYHTSGHPFLVSRLCRIITDEILSKQPNQKIWSIADVEQAIRFLLRENNTNFEDVIKNLENNSKLYDLVYRVLIDGDIIPFNSYEPTIELGVLYGVFKNNGRVRIHNRIYEQLIYDYMVAKRVVAGKDYNYSGHFLLDDNALDMKAVLLKFQQFMKEQYDDKNDKFIEHHGRLVFLSFLSPILNGQGYSFREVHTSLEKRLDVVVTYFQHRYILELKRWYGPKAHEKGLTQLADYLDIHGVDKGFLLIFDYRKTKVFKEEVIQHNGKEIFAVWV